MADVEERLYTRTQAIPGLTTLVGTNVSAVRRNPDRALPAVVMRRISTVRPQAMGSAPGNVHARIQFACVGRDPGECRAVAAALRGDGNGSAPTGIHRWRDSGSAPAVEDVLLDNESEVDPVGDNLFELRADYMVFYRES